MAHTLPAPPVFLRRSQWSANGQGLTLHSGQRTYQVTRELIGESERMSIQAAVLLAEQWTDLTTAEIRCFLTEEEDRSQNGTAHI